MNGLPGGMLSQNKLAVPLWDHQVVQNRLVGIGRHADLTPKWMIQHDQQKNQQPDHGRQYPGQRRLKRIAFNHEATREKDVAIAPGRTTARITSGTPLLMASKRCRRNSTKLLVFLFTNHVTNLTIICSSGKSPVYECPLLYHYNKITI